MLPKHLTIFCCRKLFPLSLHSIYANHNSLSLHLFPFLTQRSLHSTLDNEIKDKFWWMVDKLPKYSAIFVEVFFNLCISFYFSGVRMRKRISLPARYSAAVHHVSQSEKEHLKMEDNYLMSFSCKSYSHLLPGPVERMREVDAYHGSGLNSRFVN